jgi:hypothetical protein
VRCVKVPLLLARERCCRWCLCPRPQRCTTLQVLLWLVQHQVCALRRCWHIVRGSWPGVHSIC